MSTTTPAHATFGADVALRPTEDELVFGKDAWVYCNQHMRPHITGWCSVAVRDKVGLGAVSVVSADAAYEKCREWGFALYTDRQEETP